MGTGTVPNGASHRGAAATFRGTWCLGARLKHQIVMVMRRLVKVWLSMACLVPLLIDAENTPQKKRCNRANFRSLGQVDAGAIEERGRQFLGELET